MNRQELIKEAFNEAWEGYIAALKDLSPCQIEVNDAKDKVILMANLAPIAAQIYRQLSTVTYIKTPIDLSFSHQQMLAEVLEESGVNFIIMPNEIETIVNETEDDS